MPVAAVLNPGAAEHDDRTVLLLRVEDATGYSSIYAARSDDGVSNWHVPSNRFWAMASPAWPPPNSTTRWPRSWKHRQGITQETEHSSL